MTGTRLSKVPTRVGQERAYRESLHLMDAGELADELAYLQAARREPPQISEAGYLSASQRLMLLLVEKARRGRPL